MEDVIRVEVVYGIAGRQVLRELEVPAGTTVRQAVDQSGILEDFPEINMETAKVGIFSELTDQQAVLSADDRVEIYRPLRVDPKEARRRRARKSR